MGSQGGGARSGPSPSHRRALLPLTLQAQEPEEPDVLQVYLPPPAEESPSVSGLLWTTAPSPFERNGWNSRWYCTSMYSTYRSLLEKSRKSPFRSRPSLKRARARACARMCGRVCAGVCACACACARVRREHSSNCRNQRGGMFASEPSMGAARTAQAHHRARWSVCQ